MIGLVLVVLGQAFNPSDFRCTTVRDNGTMGSTYHLKRDGKTVIVDGMTDDVLRWHVSTHSPKHELSFYWVSDGAPDLTFYHFRVSLKDGTFRYVSAFHNPGATHEVYREVMMVAEGICR